LEFKKNLNTRIMESSALPPRPRKSNQAQTTKDVRAEGRQSALAKAKAAAEAKTPQDRQLKKVAFDQTRSIASAGSSSSLSDDNDDSTEDIPSFQAISCRSSSLAYLRAHASTDALFVPSASTEAVFTPDSQEISDEKIEHEKIEDFSDDEEDNVPDNSWRDKVKEQVQIWESDSASLWQRLLGKGFARNGSLRTSPRRTIV